MVLQRRLAFIAARFKYYLINRKFKLKINKYSFIFEISAAIVLTACGGGGGTVVPAVIPTSYSAGLAIGDSGILVVDDDIKTYSLTIENSSFGLVGTTINGSIFKNADGSYDATNSLTPGITSKLFKTTNLAVMAIPVTLPTVGTIYSPVFAIKNGTSISDANIIVSSSNTVRSVDYGYKKVAGVKSYKATGGSGYAVANSTNSITFNICDNDGHSANNSNLVNCINAPVNSVFKKSATFTYSSSLNKWVQQNTANGLNIYAVFTKTPENGNVVGYIDTSDISGEQSSFKIVSIGSNMPVSITGTVNVSNYQACSSIDNCASVPTQGIYQAVVTISGNNSSRLEPAHDNGGICTQNSNFNSPVDGMLSTVWDPIFCNYRADGLSFNITENLFVMAGYYDLITPNASKIAVMWISK